MMQTKKVVRDLKSAGLIHKKLLNRTRVLTLISIVLISITVYEIVRYGISVPISLGIGVVAFLLGVYIFTRMGTVVWDEKSQMISTGRMDTLGVAVVILYIGFEVGLRSLVEANFGMVAGSSGYLLMGVGASLLGRAVGTFVSIHTFVTQDKIPDTHKDVLSAKDSAA